MSLNSSSNATAAAAASFTVEGEWVFYVSNGINILCLLPLLFQFPILASYLFCGTPKDLGKVLTNIFHQIGWVIGINGMPYTYVIHVIFVQLIGMGVLQWFRHDRAQTVVLCVMIHYCSVAIVVGYNKITALKIKPGCGPHHDYFFNTLVFMNLIARLSLSGWRPEWCPKGCSQPPVADGSTLLCPQYEKHRQATISFPSAGEHYQQPLQCKATVCNPFAVCHFEEILIATVCAITLTVLGIVIIRKRAESARHALEFEKGYVDAFDKLQEEEAKTFFQPNGLPVGFTPSETVIKQRKKELESFKYGNNYICFIGYGLQHVSYFIILIIGNILVTIGCVVVSVLLFVAAFLSKKANPPIADIDIGSTANEDSSVNTDVKMSEYVVS